MHKNRECINRLFSSLFIELNNNKTRDFLSLFGCYSWKKGTRRRRRKKWNRIPSNIILSSNSHHKPHSKAKRRVQIRKQTKNKINDYLSVIKIFVLYTHSLGTETWKENEWRKCEFFFLYIHSSFLSISLLHFIIISRSAWLKLSKREMVNNNAYTRNTHTHHGHY